MSLSLPHLQNVASIIVIEKLENKQNLYWHIAEVGLESKILLNTKIFFRQNSYFNLNCNLCATPAPQSVIGSNETSQVDVVDKKDSNFRGKYNNNTLWHPLKTYTKNIVYCLLFALPMRIKWLNVVTSKVYSLHTSKFRL